MEIHNVQQIQCIETANYCKLIMTKGSSHTFAKSDKRVCL